MDFIPDGQQIEMGIKKEIQAQKLKLGHAGTLDPLATGLLLICTGKMTKKSAKSKH